MIVFVSGLIFLHEAAAMPFLCVPLYLPTVIERNFHGEEPWMAQSAGGPHNSFQPIIQMGIAIQTRSLQVPLPSPWDGFTGWASPGIYLTLRRAAGLFICCLSSAAWKRTSFPESNTVTREGSRANQVLSWREWRPCRQSRTGRKDWCAELASSPHTPLPLQEASVHEAMEA